MKRVTNTTQQVIDDPLAALVSGLNIEEQEKRGQQELVNSSQLPVKLGIRGDAKQEYEKRGIKVLGPSAGDPLFYDVELPAGWQTKATDHSMWNHLLDAEGEKVAEYFYKAAFYDRDAFIRFD
jgi:hypothetical protein